MTSNIGNQLIRDYTIGFEGEEEKISEEPGYQKMKERITEMLKQNFKPEFLNRIDEIIIFHALTEKEISKIMP